MKNLTRKESIPWLLAGLRLLLGPVIVLAAETNSSPGLMTGILLTGLFSDIFDGLLARRWKCDTIPVRRFDSLADNIFYLCAGFSLWVMRPQLITANAILLAACLGFEVVNIAFALLKFCKVCNYHSAMAKLWGMLLSASIVAAFFNHAAILLPIALAFGCLTNAETLLMSLMLPIWQKDILTLPAAWRRRQQLLNPRPARRARGFFAAITTALLLAILIAPQARADDTVTATYTGGTALNIANGTTGEFQMNDANIFLFHPTGYATSAIDIPIHYADITRYDYESPVAHHLGVLPAIGVGLLAARIHLHTLTITYIGPDHASQIAVFELQPGASTILLPLLHARASRACNASFGTYNPCKRQ